MWVSLCGGSFPVDKRRCCSLRGSFAAFYSKPLFQDASKMQAFHVLDVHVFMNAFHMLVKVKFWFHVSCFGGAVKPYRFVGLDLLNDCSCYDVVQSFWGRLYRYSISNPKKEETSSDLLVCVTFQLFYAC